jgi:hypothetical protein
MNTFLISLAYKHVALAVMLALANDFAKKTQLPIEGNLTAKDVQSGSHVSPPRLMGFGGSVMTTNYFFGFNNGYLANFKKLEPKLNSDAAYQARNKQLAGMKSEVDSIGAFQLATNWLIKAGLDVMTLESKSGHKTTQRSFLNNPRGAGLAESSNVVVWLPVFDIEWGKKEVRSQSATYTLPLLVVTIFGPTQELIEMHITDDAVMGGIKQPIKDVEKLLAVADATFLRYDELQKSNLVAGFATNVQPPNATAKPGLMP